MDKLNIKLMSEQAVAPKLATDGSAGYDLVALIDEPVEVKMGEVVLVPTGIAIELPKGTAALIMARSGLGIKYGVAPANAVGLIDSDYRGEIKVGLTCHKTAGYTIQPGERIAQMVITPVLTPTLEIVQELEDSQRGEGGFGSTGKA